MITMPYNTAGLQPFSLGNVLAQAEGIKGARIKNALLQDPNSLQNQLMQAQVDAARGAGGIDIGTVNPRDFTAESIKKFRQTGDFNQLQRYNAPKAAIRIDAGDAWEMYHPITNDLLKRIPKQLGPDKTLDYIGDAATTKAQATADVELATKPEIAKQTKVAEQQAASESPDAVAAAETRAADNEGIRETIAFLLSPRDAKNKQSPLNLSYAYGRANVAPDFVKPAEWIDAEAQRDRIISSLQLENVKKLKGTGPITENEQKILAKAASVLNNPLISWKLAEKELRRVDAMFAKWGADAQKAAGMKPTPQTGMSDSEYEQRKKALGL